MTDEPKYKGLPMGHPLDMLAEEGSEVSIARSKWNRFGKDGGREFGYTGPTPEDQIHHEVGDFLAVLQHNIAVGNIDPVLVNQAIINKREHVKKSFGEDLHFAIVPLGIFGVKLVREDKEPKREEGQSDCS